MNTSITRIFILILLFTLYLGTSYWVIGGLRLLNINLFMVIISFFAVLPKYVLLSSIMATVDIFFVVSNLIDLLQLDTFFNVSDLGNFLLDILLFGIIPFVYESLHDILLYVVSNWVYLLEYLRQYQ